MATCLGDSSQLIHRCVDRIEQKDKGTLKLFLKRLQRLREAVLHRLANQ